MASVALSNPIPNRVRVSVLMLVYDRPELIGRAIRSVLGQQFEDWELIVVHDGPNQRIEAIMRDWVAQDSRIRYLRRRSPGNIANAYNYGITHARGAYIAILDDDDYWSAPDKLSKQVAFLDEHSNYVGCGGGMIVIDSHGKELMRYLKHEYHSDICRSALLANPMAHSTTMFRREIGDELTSYDDSLSGFQDWDIWLTLANKGKLYNFQEIFTRYTLWEGGGSFRQHRANAMAGIKIVWRHRGSYSNVPGALVLAFLHYTYACLPLFVKQQSFSFLSRLKKTIFACHTASTAVTSKPVTQSASRLQTPSRLN
jgi:glycosyltransferase involved in cell wall biosynthesis